MHVAKERTFGAPRTFLFLEEIRSFSPFSCQVRSNPLEET